VKPIVSVPADAGVAQSAAESNAAEMASRFMERNLYRNKPTTGRRYCQLEANELPSQLSEHSLRKLEETGLFCSKGAELVPCWADKRLETRQYGSHIELPPVTGRADYKTDCGLTISVCRGVSSCGVTVQ
jgi:hypothetical protein